MIKYVYTSQGIEPKQLEGFFEGWLSAPSPETHLRILENSTRVVLAMDEETIAGCGRLEDHGHIMMLRPLVTAKPYQGHGVGKLILKAIIPDDKSTALVARDEAVAFYQGMGFSHTDWNTVSASQRAECESCPNRAVCTPQPMIYIPAAGIGSCDMKGEFR